MPSSTLDRDHRRSWTRSGRPSSPARRSLAAGNGPLEPRVCGGTCFSGVLYADGCASFNGLYQSDLRPSGAAGGSRELGDDDVGQQSRTCAAVADRVIWRGSLDHRLAGSAEEALPNMPNDLGAATRDPAPLVEALRRNVMRLRHFARRGPDDTPVVGVCPEQNHGPPESRRCAERRPLLAFTSAGRPYEGKRPPAAS